MNKAGRGTSGAAAAGAPRNGSNGTSASPSAGSEATLKMKNLKGIHEDDGGDSDLAPTDLQPLDAQVLSYILESMGGERHEPRVINQLQEFVHRTSCALFLCC